jgi:CRP-like cAMP-binding protein
LPITQKEIGNLIGTSRETVNEELDKLREMDLVETKDRHILIKDLATLDNEAVLIDAKEIIK